MSLLTKSVEAVWNVINTPDTFRKGEEFESYVRKYLFPKDKYNTLQRTHNYVGNKDDFVDNTKEPDFKFKSASGVTFFLEAKYRSKPFKGAIEWCKPYQLRRYHGINQHTLIYVVIGVGQKPNNPAQLFFIPLKDIKYTKLFPSFLQPYKVSTRKCILENQLI
ncbi:hypothetical protein ACFLXD_06350 [Chloroflexota bacterium]